jgi:uncharacterized membrane protein YkvI
MDKQRARASWFQRFLLPGFAFKAVVIGGGYATGRELAEFFVPSGPWGGLAAMLVAAILWSLVCAGTFAVAVAAGAYDYRTFFRLLLGRGWFLFEIAYSLFVSLILAVYSAAAGAIGQELFGWLPLIGAVALAVAIALFATFGNRSIEPLFNGSRFCITRFMPRSWCWRLRTSVPPSRLILRDRRLPRIGYPAASPTQATM